MFKMLSEYIMKKLTEIAHKAWLASLTSGNAVSLTALYCALYRNEAEY